MTSKLLIVIFAFFLNYTGSLKFCGSQECVGSSRRIVCRSSPLSTGAGILLSTNDQEKTPSALKRKYVLDKAAKLMGYCLGAGSTVLYAPILVNLLRSKNAEGLSISTWVMNVLGTLLALSYPIKQEYPLSTYIDLTTILLQGLTILGLVCFYRGIFVQFAATAIPISILFALFLRSKNIPSSVTKGLQLVSITVCTAAAVPQIWLTYQTKRAGWSWITALLSTTGCAVRVFTTLRLTKDRTALVGYVLGMAANAVLFAQVPWYGGGPSRHA